MAFPFLSETLFEAGTRDHFDATSDTQSHLTFPHYSVLAQVPGMPAPYRGAYCMQADLSKGTTDAYIQETGSWDTSAAGTIWFRWMLWVDKNLTMANNDEFAIHQLWSSTNTVESTVVINYTTANGLRIGVGELTGSQFLPLPQGKWVCVELKAVIDSGVGNDGTLDLYLDGAHATQVTALDQGAITSGVMGTIGVDAGTTTGKILFDWVISDDAQIFPRDRRYSTAFLMTVSGHAFVGPGSLENVTLLSGAGTDNVLQVFDTDVANTNDSFDTMIELKNTANNETVDPAQAPVQFIRGCYVKLAGTNPRALVKIAPGSAWGSDGAVRGYGLRRVDQPRGV